MLRTEVYTDHDWPERLRESWQELVENSPTATPFQTWEWQSTWWKHYARTKRPYLVGLYEGEDLVGLMPLYRTRGPWRSLRAMGSGASDYLHPLARAGYEQMVARELLNCLRDTDDVDLIDLHQVRETQPLAEIQDAHCDQATCLVLDLPSDFETYLGWLSKSLRYDIRRLDKKVFKEGAARIENATLENIEAGVDILFETHRQRWRKRGLPGAFVGKRAEAFHKEWAAKAVDKGWLCLGLLFVDERPAAAIYAMRLHDTCYFYQAGFNPQVGSLSPGTLLVAHTIRQSIDEGLSKFDFMRGDEPYKRRWKPQHAYKNLRFLIPAKGILGKAGRAWNALGWRVESRVRERLEGKGLF